MEIHLLFAKLAWVFFIAVMVVRPLFDLWRQKFLQKLMCYRKYLGIVAGLTAVIHVLMFFVSGGFDYSFFLGPAWNFQTLFGWGMLALIFILPPLITSNVYSQRLLRSNWKKVQMFSYPAFILTGIHVAFINNHFWQGILPIGSWLILWIWAKIRKIMVQKKDNNFCRL